MDPLAENSRRWTLYNYAYNNPMFFVDPDGMQAVPTDGYGRDLNRAGAAYDFYNYEDKELRLATEYFNDGGANSTRISINKRGTKKI